MKDLAPMEMSSRKVDAGSFNLQDQRYLLSLNP